LGTCVQQVFRRISDLLSITLKSGLSDSLQGWPLS